MNITMNELLIKKIRFEGGETSGTVSETPNSGEQNPQKGMNALMFQGLRNLMSNPNLAKSIGVEGEEKEEAADAKSYVAPYSTNIAFGQKSKIVKTALAVTTAAVAAGSITSCAPEYPKTENFQYANFENTDNEVLLAILQELKAMRQDMKDRDQRDAERDKKIDTAIDLLNQAILIMKDEQNANATFRNLILGKWDEVIAILIERGIKEDEANIILNGKLDQLISGEINIAQFMEWLNGYVKNIAEDVSAIRENIETYLPNLYNVAVDVKNNQGKELKLLESAFGYKGQLSKLIEAVTKQTEVFEQATDKLGEKMDKNFEWIAQVMGMSTAALRAEIARLGLTTNCTLQQLLAAQKAELEVNKQILAKMTALLEKYSKGELDAKAFADAIIKLLEEINSGVQSIAATVNGMADTLNKLYKSFQDYKRQSLAALGGIYMNGVINNMKADEANRLARKELEEIRAIRKELKSLDPAQLKQIITEAVKEGNKELKEAIEAQGIDYDKLEAMFKMLGKDIKDAANMSTEELKAAIEAFDKDVMGAEETQAQKLTEILEAVKNINGELSPELKAALAALTAAVNNGATNITAELKAVQEALAGISDQIAGLQETLDDIAATVRSIDTRLTLFNTYWNKALTGLGELQDILNKLLSGQGDQTALLAQFDAKLAEVIQNQQKANEYAAKAEADRATIIEKLNQYKDIDYDRLDQMLSDRDKQYFIKLANLLGVDPDKFENIGDLIRALDAKMQYIKDNGDKLDTIIDILNNWDKCCSCSDPTEGLIGDLINGNGAGARQNAPRRK